MASWRDLGVAHSCGLIHIHSQVSPGAMQGVSFSSHMVLYFTVIHESMCSFIDSFNCSLCQELGIQWQMNSGVREYQPTKGV